MRFWMFFLSFLIVRLVGDMTIFKLAFFQYHFFQNGNFMWSSILKFLVEVLLFIAMFMILQYIFKNVGRWIMHYRYELAQRNK